ncbi:MAG TPA: Crp/Fnr family transcriptional regulator [Dongiaceae bacterium]|nr:Crp/Fnr family transcriptional regulator [Dongiaceae bacterium]
MSGNLPRSTANRLLSRLSPEDFLLLQPNLKWVDLPLRRQLERPNKPIDQIYFLESGFASVVADGSGGRGIEVGLIGREGMTGLSVLMGTDRSPHETFIQSAGEGVRISAGSLRRAMDISRTLHGTLLLYAHAFALQVTNTAMANGRSKIEQRLARWLLMAQDRIGKDEVLLTHELLSLMLGVRRPGVTVALKLLEEAGVLRARRGLISITDRRGLERLADRTYGVAEAEYRRLLG